MDGNQEVESRAPEARYLGVACQVVVTISYVVGAVGNAAALRILAKSARLRNRKHTFMLRCLATNDLVALLGMLVLMHLQLYWRHLMPVYWFCVFRVLLRAFGLGSGCVAIVMAFERWLALTRPFQCKKYVTYAVVKRAIFYLWATGAAVTCLPFLGFGLFFNQECLRYRDATEPKDIAYAYIFFTFGTLLCACIVWCNLGVMKELARIGNRKRMLVRRISRSFSRSSNEQVTQCNPTAEELAFAKLMAVLCISFVICWMPQMVSIPMAQLGTKTLFSNIFFRMADILMAVHFTLDPYVYVLLRFKKGRCRQNNADSLPLHTPTDTKPTQILTSPK